MDFNIEVNNISIKAHKGETILQALQRNGIQVPTLCYMAGKQPTGACRMCVVEVEGYPGLIPSCSHPVEDWMKIKTHSPRVIKARKAVVELLLASHPDDCLYCVRNGNCELQRFAEELNVRERRFPSNPIPATIDKSSYSIVRDSAKCILCGRCIRVCEEMQSVSTFDYVKRGNNMYIGTSLDKPMNMSNCIDCGQCTVSCPTGALYEKDNTPEVHKALYDPNTKVVALIDYATGISVAQEFGTKAGKDMTSILVAAMRKIGFDLVYDYNLGCDIYAQEVAAIIKNSAGKTVFSSSCPGWVKFAEEYFPDLLENIALIKSPMQILGTCIKLDDSKSNSTIYTVAITPCMARKSEIHRDSCTFNGKPTIDTALTTRELIRFIKLHGIDIEHLEPELTNDPFSTSSSAGKLFSYAGGESEAIIRSLHFLIGGEENKCFKITKLRSSKEIKEYNFTIGDREFLFASVSGLANARNYLEAMGQRNIKPDYVEIMACPGGCINGGGQPIQKQSEKYHKARIKSILDMDEKDSLKAPYRNPAVRKWELCRPDNKLLLPTYKQRDTLL